MANANVIYYGQYPIQSVGNYNPNYFQTVHPLQLAGTYDPRFSQPVVRAPLAPPRAAVAPALRPEDAAAVEELGPEGVETGKNALNVAGALVKGVFTYFGSFRTSHNNVFNVLALQSWCQFHYRVTFPIDVKNVRENFEFEAFWKVRAFRQNNFRQGLS